MQLALEDNTHYERDRDVEQVICSIEGGSAWSSIAHVVPSQVEREINEYHALPACFVLFLARRISREPMFGPMLRPRTISIKDRHNKEHAVTSKIQIHSPYKPRGAKSRNHVASISPWTSERCARRRKHRPVTRGGMAYSNVSATTRSAESPE